MDLAHARLLITANLERMRTLYGQVVFDEWAILSVHAKHSGLLAYSGSRMETFRAELAKDVDPLRRLVTDKKLAPGDFEFTAEGAGTRHDALLMVGDAAYLVLNHLEKSMSEIRADPRWLKAQEVFFELSEKFRKDPLKVEAGKK